MHAEHQANYGGNAHAKPHADLYVMEAVIAFLSVSMYMLLSSMLSLCLQCYPAHLQQLLLYMYIWHLLLVSLWVVMCVISAWPAANKLK
jgi:hypothetical protein